MPDSWRIQSVLIVKKHRSREKAKELARRIVRKLEEPGRGGYPSIKRADEGDEYWHVRVRDPSRFSKVRTIDESDGRVKAAREISKGAKLKVGQLG